MSNKFLSSCVICLVIAREIFLIESHCSAITKVHNKFKNNNNSSMLRHGLRLIWIKSNNDYNFVKIYQHLPKFGNLGNIDNLNFSVT